MVRSGLIFIAVTGILLTSCFNNRDKEFEPGTIYFDYMVTGDEETNRVVAKLQYRAGGRNGDPMRLDPPASAVMDGEPIPPDSTEFNGVYYEVISETEGFAGSHSIEFVDADARKYPTRFDFPVFSIKNELPEIIDRNNFVLDLSGLDSSDEVRIILTDTSFYGKGVEKVISVGNGRIVITPGELLDLHNGPVHLQVIREEEKLLFPGPAKKGRLYLYYALQREFMLQDSTIVP
jgi:hypothetical protein